MAVGDYTSSGKGYALAEVWDGTAWTLQTLPKSPGSTPVLYGVACDSSGACTAVGSHDVGGNGTYSVPLVERYS